MAVTPWRHYPKTFEQFVHPEDKQQPVILSGVTEPSELFGLIQKEGFFESHQNAEREDDDRCPHCGKSWEEIPNTCWECYSSKTPTKPLEGDFDFF